MLSITKERGWILADISTIEWIKHGNWYEDATELDIKVLKTCFNGRYFVSLLQGGNWGDWGEIGEVIVNENT